MIEIELRPVKVRLLDIVSRGQTAFFRFICGATTNKTEKSGLATRDYT